MRSNLELKPNGTLLRPLTGDKFMSIEAYRWQMNQPGAPFERVAFVAEPGAAEVVVAIAGCGVCHTDLGYYYDGVRTNSALPLTLGHEISGHVVVAAAGSVG